MRISQSTKIPLLFAAIAIAGAAPTDPVLTSSFPLGGTKGSSIGVTVRGENLKDAYQVLFDCSELSAQVKDVQDLKPEEEDPKDPANKPKKLQAALLEVAISDRAAPGAHALRLVTPRGVSGPIWFVVNSDPVVPETDGQHSTISNAQLLTVPAVVNGRLGHPGELDYYAFDVVKGQELQFELVTFALKPGSINADPILILYEPGKSWFTNQKGARLEVDDISRPGLGEFSDVTSHRLPRLLRVFETGGRYTAEVGTNQGESGPDYSYQLRIKPILKSQGREERWAPIIQAAHVENAVWDKRGFAGILASNRMEQLVARGVPGSGMEIPSKIPIVREDEPNEAPDKALAFPIPAIIEGRLERPGDVDWFKFQVAAGQKVTFEIETPYLPPPFFNPRVTVSDSSGKEVFENIFKSLGGDGDDWIKTIEPRVTFTFETAGEYRLNVHDLTTQLGGADFVYRLMIRPQVPHVGKIEMRSMAPPAKLDHINLAAGEAVRVSVAGDLEEGFQGDVAISVQNLPPGVRALSTVTAGMEKPTAASGKVGGEISKERYRSPRQTTVVTFIADREAPVTKEPQMIELRVQPIIQGKPGSQFTAQRIPLAVIPAPPKEAALPQRSPEQSQKEK